MLADAVPQTTSRHSGGCAVWGRIGVLAAVIFPTWPDGWPRWAGMWALAVAIFAACKWLTWSVADRRGVPAWRQLAYLVGWPGMDAAAFLRGPMVPPVERPGAREWAWAAAKLLLGASLLWFGVRLVPGPHDLVRGWVGMVGIVFTLHFGGFDLLACVWRAFGIPAEKLMDWPILTRSVSEFWGRRWNRAFRDLTHQFLFRPLTSRLGPRTALAAGFLMSGLVHDLVISVPAHGGYGLPTLFFVIQGAAIFVERSRFGRMIGLGRGLRGWAFAAVVLLLPAPWLFHPPFIRNVILPFLSAIGCC